MSTSHITINNQIGIRNGTQSRGTEEYIQRVPVNHNQVFVSKVSRVLSLDSSIPTMPSMNSSNIAPFVPVHEPRSYLSPSQQYTEPSISRKSSGASSTGSDLYFPGDLGHNGKEDKLPLRPGLKEPIWVTPTICTHQGTNGEMCFMCRKDGGEMRRDQIPDFTLNVSRSPRKAKKCKCGTTTTLSICFSAFFLAFILAFVIYNEVVLKQQNSVIVRYKM